MSQQQQPKRVAAIATVYHRHSHADVILSKIFEGFLHDGKEFPRMRWCRWLSISFPKAAI